MRRLLRLSIISGFAVTMFTACGDNVVDTPVTALNLETGEVLNVDNTNWDIAFD